MALVERVQVACALVNSAQCEETRLEYSGKQTAAIMSLFQATPQLELAPKVLSLANLLKGGNFRGTQPQGDDYFLVRVCGLDSTKAECGDGGRGRRRPQGGARVPIRTSRRSGTSSRRRRLMRRMGLPTACKLSLGLLTASACALDLSRRSARLRRGHCSSRKGSKSRTVIAAMR